MSTTYNKVTINGTTYMDLSQDTVSSASHIRQGYVGHLNNGTQVTGTYTASPTLISKTISQNGTYTASSDNADGYSSVTVNCDFIVTLSKDAQTGFWTPDATIAELQAAYGNNQNIGIVTDYPSGGCIADGYWDYNVNALYYTVSEPEDSDLVKITDYSFTSYDGIVEISVTTCTFPGPIFSIDIDDVNKTILSITCDTSYSNCVGYVNTILRKSAIVNATYHLSGQREVLKRLGANGIYDSENHKVIYNITDDLDGLLSGLTITYNSNSTIIGELNPVDRRTSYDLTASGATVTVPEGYYGAQVTKAIGNGSEGTPTATKGSVSNHSISITPSVTNSAGYISGGTKTGYAVTVTANELASGNKSITTNGTVDVVGYSTVTVAVPSISGVDISMFTLELDENSEPTSIVCNKTFSECLAKCESSDLSACCRMIYDDLSEARMALVIRNYTDTEILYTCMYTTTPGFDIIYHSNGQIEFVDPSTALQYLPITNNGTYYPGSAKVITEVNVAVPTVTVTQSGSSLNIT